MRCRDVLRLSTEYLNSELDDRRSSAVRGHLRTCVGCERALADEARIRDVTASLEPLDPPPSLWLGIEQRLAAAEIDDAGRSRLWLWWHAARQHLAYVALAGAAALVFALWARGRSDDGDQDQLRSTVRRASVDTAKAPPDHSSPDLAESYVERAVRQLRETDERYLEKIGELRDLAAELRSEWSKTQAAVFDRRIAEFDRVTLEHRKRLALDDSGDIAARDMLFSLYQAEVAFLMDATLGEL